MAKSSLSRHLLNLKVLPTSKILKLYMSLSSILMTNSFAPMFKQKLDGCMMMICDNCLRRFNKILTHWCWMSSVKKFMHSWQMTLHDMSKQWSMNPVFFQKKVHLNWDAYLSWCVHMREITVLKFTWYVTVLLEICKIYIICARLTFQNGWGGWYTNGWITNTTWSSAVITSNFRRGRT